jgi:hypothetical protein
LLAALSWPTKLIATLCGTPASCSQLVHVVAQRMERERVSGPPAVAAFAQALVMRLVGSQPDAGQEVAELVA